MSPRLGRSFNRERLAASWNNTLVNANRDLKLPADIRHDTYIVRLQEILAFLAIMRGGIATGRGGQDDPNILNRLHSEPIYCKLFTVEGKLQVKSQKIRVLMFEFQAKHLVECLHELPRGTGADTGLGTSTSQFLWRVRSKWP
jgi:hypothetical protein